MTTFNQTMLDACSAAYAAALQGRRVQFDGRHWEPHDIRLLGLELQKWKMAVAGEQRQAAGGSPTSFSTASFSDG